MWQQFWTDRGQPWDHDPGPTSGSGWSELFAQTPDYRQIGRDLLQREAFRWHFGPMFYRGRLGADQVKVLLIGQEGAQDESLAHRSFAGGTGSRMQHFLRSLGITQSYLFLNTFVYPIFGQYTAELRPLAQSATSPIVQHRHTLFERVAQTNPHLALVISVGNAAKESVATWKTMRGGNFPNGVRTIHVVHPGAGTTPEQAATVRSSFQRAFRQVLRWANDDPSWLPIDTGGTRVTATAYRFGDAPIPFADLPLGLAWRVGRGGTSSNRRDGQTAIQVFSASGRYNNQGHTLSYSGSTAGSQEGYDQDAGDRAFEPPRNQHDDFDRGPGSTLARLLMAGQSGLDWPDFSALQLPAHPSFGFGPIYRGRPDAAIVLVVTDQESQDDLFTGRAATGDGGQRLQQFLFAGGYTRRYAILRTLPVNTAGATTARVRTAVEHPQVRALHTAIIQQLSTVRAILAVGPHAQALITAIAPSVPNIINMKLPGASGWLADWQSAFTQFRSLALTRDQTPAASYDGSRRQIPRIDLPYGTLRWWGSSGNRAVQARRDGALSPDYFKYVMPAWAADL